MNWIELGPDWFLNMDEVVEVKSFGEETVCRTAWVTFRYEGEAARRIRRRLKYVEDRWLKSDPVETDVAAGR